MSKHNTPPTVSRFRRTRTVFTALLLAGMTACDLDDLLDVDQPFTVTPPVAQDPENLPTAFAGAMVRFATAYAGLQNDNGGIIHHSGMLADEIWGSDSYPTRREIDQRQMDETNSTVATDYARIHLARNLAEQTAALYAASPENESDDHAELLSLAGFSYLFFGENYCGAVPFSTLPIGAGETVYGEAETTVQIFERARSRFTEAAEFASGDLLNLAKLGIARAELNLGRFNEAAQQASGVPTNFEYDITYSAASTPTFNAVYNMVNGEKRFSVWGASPVTGEGVNGLPYSDPRTPKSGPNDPFTGTPGTHWSQEKYPDVEADIPLATGVEARLIEAEAALKGNNVVTFVAMHNAARGQRNLPPLVLAAVQAMTPAQRENLHFQERAYHLWLTAHRLGDLRRLVRQYGRSPNQVYPIGITVFGEPYGNHLALRVPFDERNNPRYDPSLCTPEAPDTGF